MVRVLAFSAAASALVICLGVGPQAAAAPPAPGATAYLIGNCYDPSQPVEERPTEVVYNCDQTGVMEGMTWTAWGPDGADGTGTDNSVECQPNCAVGERLINPIVVHAWNPMPPAEPGCPAGVQFYTDLVIAYPNDAPPWIKPGTTWSAGTEFIEYNGMPAVHFFDQEPYSCAPIS